MVMLRPCFVGSANQGEQTFSNIPLSCKDAYQF